MSTTLTLPTKYSEPVYELRARATTMNNNGFCVGMPIRFTRAYSSNPKKRLKGGSGKEAIPLYDMEIDDVVPADAGHGIVVGQRNYIMSNWIRGHDSEAGYWIDGKKRAMLLVSVGFVRSFILVKPEDAEPAIPPEWEQEPERECPQTPHCPNSCGRPSGECGGCTYEELRIDAFPCSRCWNGDGNGVWCYCEAPLENHRSCPLSWREHQHAKSYVRLRQDYLPSDRRRQERINNGKQDAEPV